MPADLQSLQAAVAIVIGLLTILGIILGWFQKLYHWVASLFNSKTSSAVFSIPSKTVILMPVPRQNALWWHMGSTSNQPLMQIVGDLNVTNISKYGVYLMAAKLRKPPALGHVAVRAQDSHMYSDRHMIPPAAISDLRFDFYVQPAVCTVGKTFKADVAIVDQFGNEHWLKNLEFLYS